MKQLCTLMILILWPLTLWAGPWAPDPGRTLAILDVDPDRPSIWVERGLHPNLWLSAKAERLPQGDSGVEISSYWGRRFGAIAVSLGVGANSVIRDTYSESALLLRVGVGYGWDQSWASFEASHSAFDDPYSKAALTLGHHIRPDLRLMAEVEGHWPRHGDEGFQLAPKAIWSWRENIALSLGIRHDLFDDKTRLTLGSWFSF